ncbi:MAG: DUF3015 family protein [Candidatus Omnitrophica bacterium]|nr:DUF3015 family protein [Candidatus Omnitrophota bacterium]
MFKVIKISALGILVFLAFTQPAMSRDFADIYTECGLGAMIAPRNAAVAAVTNVTWDSGTTAISSNISSPDTCKGGQPRTAAFIHQSYPALEKDLASGNGIYLDTLAVLAGHSASDKTQFIASLRSDFSKVVASAGYSDKSSFEKSEALYNAVYKNS